MATIAPDVMPLINSGNKRFAGNAQPKGKTPVVAVLIVLAVLLVFSGYFRQLFAPPRKSTVTVVGAKTDLQAGTKLGFSNLHYIQVPERYLTKDMMISSEQAVGFVTRQFVQTGEPLTADCLFARKQTMSAVCETHERAMTLRLDDESLVDHNMFPDDRVDVIATSTKNGRKYTKTICQDIRVLMCTTKNAVASGRNRVNSNLVTVAATPTQVEYLAEAAETGKLRLVLRSRLTTNTHKLPGISEDDILPAVAFERQPSPGQQAAGAISQPQPQPQPPMLSMQLPPPPVLPGLSLPNELSSLPAAKPLQWIVEMFSAARKDTVEVGSK